jgi:hypothetical protein
MQLHLVFERASKILAHVLYSIMPLRAHFCMYRSLCANGSCFIHGMLKARAACWCAPHALQCVSARLMRPCQTARASGSGGCMTWRRSGRTGWRKQSTDGVSGAAAGVAL